MHDRGLNKVTVCYWRHTPFRCQCFSQKYTVRVTFSSFVWTWASLVKEIVADPLRLHKLYSSSCHSWLQIVTDSLKPHKLNSSSCRNWLQIVNDSLKMQIWNRARPRGLVQNQHTRELISARKTSHKHNNTDLSRLRRLSSGMHINTRYINSTSGTPSAINSTRGTPSAINSTRGTSPYLVFTRMPGESYRRLYSCLLN